MAWAECCRGGWLHPELQARLKGVDPYEVVDIAAAEGFQFGVFTLHRAVCTGYAMRKVRR